jgi:hypothetical protein
MPVIRFERLDYLEMHALFFFESILKMYGFNPNGFQKIACQQPQKKQKFVLST